MCRESFLRLRFLRTTQWRIVSMTLLEFVKSLNLAIVILFTLLYLYQGFYIVVGLVRRRWTEIVSSVSPS